MKTRPNIRIYIIILCTILISAFLNACGSEPLVPYSYRQPKQMDGGLAMGSLSEVNLDVDQLESAVDDINSGKFGEIHSMIIYKDGRLVLEEYFPGHDFKWDAPNHHGRLVYWDTDVRHNVASVGKSITSACVGIAIEEGFIESVDQSIFDYLPEHQYLNSGEKSHITIEHLLTMSAGLQWDEWGTSFANQDNDLINLWFDCDDPIACILKRPLVGKPGTVFTYNSGNTILLGEIIRNATGLDIEAFSWKYLFEPLGVEEPSWEWINNTGVVYAGGSQRMTPREMLKFGVMYLKSGVWNGQQIVSREWVESSAAPYKGPDNTWLNHSLRQKPPGDGTWGQRGYSYSWWTHEFSRAGKKIPAYWAFGWGGQAIWILPDQNMVFVIAAGNYNKPDSSVKILKEYVIPALDLY